MTGAKSFFKTTVLGGLVVILPAAIIALVFGWIYRMVTGAIQPLTNPLTKGPGMPPMVADLIVIIVIIGVCFALGLAVRTSVGRFVHGKLEDKLARFAPGYRLVKETVLQFLGKKKSPFSQVALAQIYENQTLVTAFVTEEHENGMYSVFVPTGPNPTSGQIFHLEPRFVHLVDVGIEDAMRSIISCGAGSAGILARRRKES
ncbi:MAG: DUF502 domain-containing protein [Polyangia bacterium]